MRADYVIVGSGLTGATIARSLVDRGGSVLVVDRRPYLGGNVADYVHPSGINVQRHGPHYFRTSSRMIWDFVNRFGRFHEFEAVVKTRVGGRLENWPVSGEYIRRTVGENWSPEFVGAVSNFEEAALSLMPRCIYDRFVRGYTEKQWGRSPTQLSASLCRRFDVREDDDPRLTPRAKYQGVPTEGYSRMMERMLDGIPLRLNCDYLRERTTLRARQLLIFTGPIDAYFDNCLGRLTYRGQARETTYVRDRDWLMPCVQVNEPGPSCDILRTIEWKHLMRNEDASQIRGTVVTSETPCTPLDSDRYEYPFPDQPNRILYRRYRQLAQREHSTLFCGRLGEYRYLDMDQAIGRAMKLADRIHQGTINEPVLQPS